MISKEKLREIVLLQKKQLENEEIGTKREITHRIDLTIPFATVLTGIRRSGKSTLLKQLYQKNKKVCFFNFEDSRTINFEVSDFEILAEIFEEEFGKNE